MSSSNSKKGCDNFSWSPISALRKATSDVTINIGGVITKTTESNNPEQDAYRNCSNCKTHYNYHKN